MKKLILAILVLVAVVFGVTIIVNSNNPPRPTITIENNELKVVQGSYCWEGIMSAECMDKISPAELIGSNNIKPVVVSPGAELTIDYEQKPKENTLYVSIWLNNEQTKEVQLHNNKLFVPTEKGIYIYGVSASWEKGSSSNVFVIEVR